MSSDRSSHKRSDNVASTSRSLLARLRDRDSAAWDRLIALYTPLVYYWCQRVGLTNQDIPDVVQEVFKSVATSIDRFRKERPQDTFRGWLRTITRSKAADHFRHQTRQPKAAGGSESHRRMLETEFELEVEAADDAEDSIYNDLFLRALDLIRNDFRENTWRAFWLVVVEGVSTEDVARQLEMRPGTVRVAKSRVLKRLREELGELMD